MKGHNIERHLKEQGITIESFVHHNGSPYGQYWGYFVAEHNGSGKPILHGKKSHGKQLPTDPFSRRRQAIKLAMSLADPDFDSDSDSEDTNGNFDLHEDPPQWWVEWIDIGGEA